MGRQGALQSLCHAGVVVSRICRGRAVVQLRKMRNLTWQCKLTIAAVVAIGMTRLPLHGMGMRRNRGMNGQLVTLGPIILVGTWIKDASGRRIHLRQ